MQISISRVHFPVTTLGPGKRIGIWFQGCSLRCKGCISPDTWHEKESHLTVEMLLCQLNDWLPQADGITISGGEPFDQPEALHQLLHELRKVFSGDIFVYSGYSLSEITPKLTVMSGLIDALMSEPFQIERTQTRVLRGSDNQQLHKLTPLGHQKFADYDRQRTDDDKRLDIAFDEQGRIFIMGIAERDDITHLQQLLEQQDSQFKQLKK